MENIFKNNTISINVYREKEDKISLSISADYTYSNHKGTISVPTKKYGDDFESTWKSIKTKKLQSMSLSFGEIDWYDDEVDVYETPIFSMERGLRKVKINNRRHGSIPKDWSADLDATLLDTATVTPVIEVIKAVLGYKFTETDDKKFRKEVKSFMQKKEKYYNFSKES